MHPTTASNSEPGLAVAALSVALAIGVFGVIYGAAARPVLGTGLTLLSSLVVFSGAAQFTLIALLAAGVGTAGILGGVATLALRHLPLGAVLRPRLAEASRSRRALLSLFLIDETVGLALTRRSSPARTLTISGGFAYGAWVVGTAAGAAGASLAAVEPLAESLFPVLFIGLAALGSTTRRDGARAVLAAACSLGLLLAAPGVGALGAIAVAVVVVTVVPAP